MTNRRSARRCRPWRWWPSLEGLVERAISFAARAVAVTQRNEAPWAYHLIPHLWHGSALADADRLEEAETAFQAGRWRAEHSGTVAALPLYHWALAELRLAAGRWDDAVAEAQAGLGFIEETATRVGDVFANAVCADVAFHRGETGAGPGRGARGPPSAGRGTHGDRLRMDDLDRSAAPRGVGPTDAGSVAVGAGMGSRRPPAVPPGGVARDGTRPGEVGLGRGRLGAGPGGHRRARTQRRAQPRRHRPGPRAAVPRSARRRP